jgi:hypothetical protein
MSDQSDQMAHGQTAHGHAVHAGPGRSRQSLIPNGDNMS